MSYWDTSALAKLFVTESDSPLFRSRAGEGTGKLRTLEFTRLELWSVFRRKEAEEIIQRGEAKKLLADFDDDVTDGFCLLIRDSVALRRAFEDIIEKCLSQRPPVFIRTLDALHLAAATVAGEKEFVATDRRLRMAAALLGFALFPPDASILP